MIAIRAMQTRDVESVAELEKEIFTQPWSRKGFQDALELENTVFLVAVEEERILGYIGMYTSLDEGEITNVAVDAKERCRGIGELLIQGMIHRAKLCGIEQIVLEVRVSNASAIRLYERNGFVKQGVRRGFYEMPKEDAYIMIYGQ